MQTTFFKRACAYVLDFVIISLLVSLLSFVPFLNPNRVQYSEKYNELLEVRDQYVESQISEEEFEQAYKPIAYEIYRLNTNYVIIDLVCVLLYFGVFQYFFEGQTVGKKLFGIRVVSNNENKLTLLNFILRSIVLSNVIISIALQCIVHFMDVEHYYPVYSNVNLVGTIILYIILFMALVRQDGRGLHDFVGGTKVIFTADYDEKKRMKIAEEQKVLESEYEIKATIKEPIKEEPKKKTTKEKTATTKKNTQASKTTKKKKESPK